LRLENPLYLYKDDPLKVIYINSLPMPRVHVSSRASHPFARLFVFLRRSWLYASSSFSYARAATESADVEGMDPSGQSCAHAPSPPLLRLCHSYSVTEESLKPPSASPTAPPTFLGRERNATTRIERETMLVAFASYPPPCKLLHSIQLAPQQRSRAWRTERGNNLLPPHPISMEGESCALLPNHRFFSSFLLYLTFRLDVAGMCWSLCGMFCSWVGTGTGTERGWNVGQPWAWGRGWDARAAVSHAKLLFHIV
jgi:hypothetical protein